jgi:hypothetical protein
MLRLYMVINIRDSNLVQEMMLQNNYSFLKIKIQLVVIK